MLIIIKQNEFHIQIRLLLFLVPELVEGDTKPKLLFAPFCWKQKGREKGGRFYSLRQAQGPNILQSHFPLFLFGKLRYLIFSKIFLFLIFRLVSVVEPSFFTLHFTFFTFLPLRPAGSPPVCCATPGPKGAFHLSCFTFHSFNSPFAPLLP